MFGCRSGICLLANLLLVSLIANCACVDYRLNKYVLPSYYNLTIGIQGEAANPGTTFDGEVNITLLAKQANINSIRLHKDSIDIQSCILYDADGVLVEQIANNRLTFEQETQQLTVPLTKPLTFNQNYTLYFKYTGTVRKDTAGLFSVSYVEEQTGNTKWVLLTEMQAINARLVFPCFDEPALKAKFELHIRRPSGFNSISNTKLISTTNEANNLYVDHFDVTPIMSTYLLAFVISEYRARGDPNELAIYTRPEFYNYTEFSYNVSQRVLPFYSLVFKQSYEELGNKLFQYATTPRFPHNSMENWGLVIFKDKVVLEQEGYTDGWIQKEFTIRNIIHENAHMWFGNSVTLKWWSYVWMQEGFARYYEFFVGNELYPEYQLDQQFVVQKLQHVMSTDALNLTQPMTSPEASIQTPADIDYKFGRISFAKAASIIRMWRNAMGEDNFDKAMISYLRANHLGNTEPSDLFDYLEQYWPTLPQFVDLRQFFLDYTEQVGYPMVTVNLSLQNHQINMQQNRFLSNPGDGSNDTLRYTIPITYTTNLEANFKNLTPVMYIHKIVDTAYIYSDNPIDWVILNIKQSNYYRVLYDTPILNNIQLALRKSKHSGIAVENRAALVDDLFNFAYAGIIDYQEVFEFIEYLSTEIEYIPWFAAYDGLQDVTKRLTPQQLINFEKYLSDITLAVYPKLGVTWKWEDTVLEVYNRNMQVSWLCKYQNTACNNDIKRTFEDNAEKPSPDYRETFYCAAARTSGYERVLALYKNETNSNERELLWRAASCTRTSSRSHYETEILGSATSVSLKIVGIAQLYQQNPDLINDVYAMITEDIKRLADALGSWSKTADVLSEMADYFTTREQQQQFSEFIDKNSASFGDAVTTLKTALATVETNVQWAESRLGRLVNFLAKRNGAAAVGLTLASTVLLLLSSLLNVFPKL